jgi:hypothetical protein
MVSPQLNKPRPKGDLESFDQIGPDGDTVPKDAAQYIKRFDQAAISQLIGDGNPPSCGANHSEVPQDLEVARDFRLGYTEVVGKFRYVMGTFIQLVQDENARWIHKGIAQICLKLGNLLGWNLL